MAMAMAMSFTQSDYDTLCHKYGITPCHVAIEEMSKKKRVKLMRDLLARCKAEEDQVNVKEEKVIADNHVPEEKEHDFEKKKPFVIQKSGKKATSVTVDLESDGFSDSHDKYPKSSPESFGSEPFNTIQADQAISVTSFDPAAGGDGKENVIVTRNKTAAGSPKDRKKSPVKCEKKDHPVPTAMDLKNCFIVNRPHPNSADYDIYFLQKYNINPEAEVVIEKLDPSFIEKAKSGLVKWKNYFKNPSLELARLEVAEEPENDPEYVEEEDDDDDVTYDDDDDLDGEEGSDFEKELVAITRSQEATLRRERLSPTEPPVVNKRGRKRGSTNKKKLDSDELVDEEVKGPKVKRQRKSRIVMHKCNDCNYSSSCIKDLKLHRAKHGIGLDPITCSVCGHNSYSTFDDEMHQYESHEGPKQLPCVVFLFCKSCSRSIEGIEEFDYHIINHIRAADAGFHCTFEKCSYVNNKYATAVDHVKTHTLYKCTFCDKAMAKMELLERHCNQEHKQFGRPFQCCLCDFRCSVFGLLVKHKEELHAILTKKDSELCRFCFSLSSAIDHTFSSLEEKMAHLAIHADFDRLFKCKEPHCGFTADSASKFSDHNFANHISNTLNEEVSWEPDVPALVEAISQAIKKKFKKSTARKKPNPQETDSAVQALAGFLSDPEFVDESRSFVSGDLELDAGILSSGAFGTPPPQQSSSSMTHSVITADDYADDEDGENLVLKERPKRKSAIEAQSRLQKQKEEEAAGRIRKERRKAQLFNSTPLPSPTLTSASVSTDSTVTCSRVAALSADDITCAPTRNSPLYSNNNSSSSHSSPPSASFLSMPTTAASQDVHSMFMPTPDSPTKGPPIENIIRSLDMQENDAIPNEILNDVFMDPAESDASVSPFVYDPATRQIIYQGYAVLDETGTPLEVLPEQLESTLNWLYSQSGLV